MLWPHQCVSGSIHWPYLGLPALPSPRIATNTCLKATGHVKAHLSVPVCLKPSKGFPLIQGACLAPGTSQAPSVPAGSTRGSSLCHLTHQPSPHPSLSACASAQSHPTRHTHQQHPSPSCPFLLHHKALPSNLRHRRNIRLVWHLSPLLEDKLPWAGTSPSHSVPRMGPGTPCTSVQWGWGGALGRHPAAHPAQNSGGRHVC